MSGVSHFPTSLIEFSQRHPLTVPYVVGMHPYSPHNPYSCMANEGMPVEDFDTTEAHVLYGAVIAGPDERDRFSSEWPKTEVMALFGVVRLQ